MLKGIDPLIGPDLLRALAAMGHGDEIAIVDANFPAASVARESVLGHPLRIDCDAVRAVRAVLSLLPLDTFEPDPALTMQVVGRPEEIPEVVREAAPLFEAEGVATAALERFAFYARAKRSFAVLATAETRIYANFILRKGVVFP
ncbi:RbsD/FucU family protein [Amaricoccus solimangrovi]|uniref:Ribose ABC transporter n=1 Tax=Amaricoccus solimangrovi TaxID=2589815 RepID=A0A501WMC0_9RHOB|nr:RbsD/FucU domain-containing protein [Amaricoccus solimangrovi]TPE50943.1 ribose ABC transporter [Amaricoccus solimangrovi]